MWYELSKETIIIYDFNIEPGFYSPIRVVMFAMKNWKLQTALINTHNPILAQEQGTYKSGGDVFSILPKISR